MESVAAAPSAIAGEDQENAHAALRAVRLGLGLKLGYASGALVDGVISNVVNTFLLFYVTTVCGMSAACWPAPPRPSDWSLTRFPTR